MKRNRPMRWWPCAAGLLVALAACPARTAAQNNSLLGAMHHTNGNSRATATSQPAVAQPLPLPNSTPIPARATLKADRPDPKANGVLLVMSPFAVSKPDPEKIKVNDLVTIIVRESKTATTNAKLESKKDWSLDGAISRWINFDSVQGVSPEQFPNGKPGIALTWNNDYKGDGTYDRKDELTTRVTARVIDVKPNGNLVLEAKDDIRIDDEGYAITLTGECRSQDVTPQNTVLSTQVSDRTINVQHSGAVRDATRRGWFQRGLDLFRTF
jgi:flagellar L-ring protein FlgH